MTSPIQTNQPHHGVKLYQFNDGALRASKTEAAKEWQAARTLDKIDEIFGKEERSTVAVRSTEPHKKLGFNKVSQYKSLKVDIPKDYTKTSNMTWSDGTEVDPHTPKVSSSQKIVNSFQNLYRYVLKGK